jgi:hypothetical protein
MCYSAGRLVRVRYGAPHDVPTLVTTIVLDFEAGSWTLAVNGDDDTVLIVDTGTALLDGLHLTDAPSGSPWTQTLGTTAQWIWILENQQGYEDGIQFAFAIDGREKCRIQLIAIASGWQISDTLC